ncbi:MAG: hypothetical protein AB7D31_12030 [Stenotrophomonas sp.]
MERFLTNVQRKQLHELLLVAGIDPNVTRWSNAGMSWTRNGECETLHAGLCHFLLLPDSDGRFSMHFMPSWNGGTKEGFVNQTWKEVLEAFDFWTHKVKEELEQPDPWGTYALAALGSTPGHETDNAPFTHAEAEHVTSAVQQLIEYIQTEVPEYDSVKEEFNPQFERIAEQARSGTGRIDWKNQFVGLLINLFVALSLAPDRASLIWSYWARLINNLLLP